MSITDSHSSVTRFLQISILRNEVKQQAPNLGKLKAAYACEVWRICLQLQQKQNITKNKITSSIFPKVRTPISFAD